METSWAVISAHEGGGMGAVVTRDVPAGEVWADVPARCLRTADLPPDAVSVAPSTTGTDGERC